MRAARAITMFVIAVMAYANSVAQVRLMNLDEFERRLANGKDTTYVVNFWATWCKPCIAELPYFDKLARDSAQTRLRVLLVSVDGPSHQNVVQAFVTKRRLHAPVFVLNERKPHEWIDRVDPSWSGSVPATLLVRNGRRTFREQEFSYESLLQEIISFQSKD